MATNIPAEQADIVVCMRVIDLPIPYAVAEIERCAECDERIWVAGTSPKGITRICFPCAEKKVAKIGEEPKCVVTEATWQEVVKYLKPKVGGR